MAGRPLPSYVGDEPYVFVTYSHQDTDVVYPHIRWLQDQGFNVAWDEGISPGAVWRAELADAIQGCSLLLYLVTPQSVASEHCTREVNFTLDEHHRPVLAVHLVQTALPGALALSLSDRQAILAYALKGADLERKLASAVTTCLNQPVPEIVQRSAYGPATSRRIPLSSAVVSALVFGAIAVAATWMVLRPPSETPRLVSRFSLGVPGARLEGIHPFSLSRDGRHLVFVGESQIGRRVYLRRMDELQAMPIDGTAGVEASAYLSWDGESVMFFNTAENALKKVPVRGGAAVTVMHTGGPIGSSTARDGSLVIAESRNGALMRVAEPGGVPEQVTWPAEGEAHRQPWLLADGSTVLFHVESDGSDAPRIAVRSLDTGEQHFLIEGAQPKVTSSGHLLFLRVGQIWASAFDLDRLELIGAAVPVLGNVAWIEFYHSARFDVAEDGSLVYQPAAELEPNDTLNWMSPDASELPVPPGRYVTPRVSPTGDRLVFSRGHELHLWIYSVQRHNFTRLTQQATVIPLWSPNGKKLVYSLFVGGVPTLHWRNADGTGMEERLVANARAQWATSWSRDGNEVLFFECDTWLSGCDLGRLSLSGERRAELFLATEFNEVHPALSPDGRWVAYESDRTGDAEIYVRPYPNVDDGLWKVSTAGGKQPIWSPNGKALYYSAAGQGIERQLMAVDIKDSLALDVGEPEVRFAFGQVFNADNRSFDVHPDGRRFLVAEPGSAMEGQPLVYVQNWLEEVEQLVPTNQ